MVNFSLYKRYTNILLTKKKSQSQYFFQTHTQLFFSSISKSAVQLYVQQKAKINWGLFQSLSNFPGFLQINTISKDN